MAKGKDAQEAEDKGQGKAVMLPNGTKRIDYIRDQYYKKGTERSKIRIAINEMLEEGGRKDEQIPYQIVFAATKVGTRGEADTDPRIASEAKAKEKADVKAAKDKAAAEAKEKAKAEKDKK